MLAALAAIVSSVVATVALFLSWRAAREGELRRGDVLAWANEVIGELRSLYLIIKRDRGWLEPEEAKARLTEIYTSFHTLSLHDALPISCGLGRWQLVP